MLIEYTVLAQQTFARCIAKLGAPMARRITRATQTYSTDFLPADRRPDTLAATVSACTSEAPPVAAPHANHEPALAHLKVPDETTRARRAAPVFVLVEDRGTMGARRIKGVDNEDSEGTSG